MACITNAGYVSAARKQAEALVTQARVDVAIQVAIALWQRNSSQSISNMQNELADQQTKLAEEVQAHAEKFWPEEKELVDDVFSEGKVTTGYASLAGAWGGFLSESMSAGRTKYIETLRNQCLGVTRCDDARWQRNTELANSDMISFAARQDEKRTEILNDRRYARQYAILKYGRGSFDAMMSYAEISQTLGINASRTLLGTINSALEGYGYYSTRNRTYQGWGAPLREQWAQPYAPRDRAVTMSPVATDNGIALGVGNNFKSIASVEPTVTVRPSAATVEAAAETDVTPIGPMGIY